MCCILRQTRHQPNSVTARLCATHLLAVDAWRAASPALEGTLKRGGARQAQLVGHFLRSTRAQYVLTTPITHNLEVFEPAEITLVTSKKPRESRWAPPIAVAKRRGVPELRPIAA